MVININKCEIWSNWKRTPTLHIFTHTGLRIHWRLLRILKTSNKSASSNVFWYVKVCIFWKWKCIQYTINWYKTQMLKKFLLDKKKKKKVQNSPSFLFPELQLVTVLLLIYDFHMSWSTRFLSLKLCVGISIFDSVLFLLKVFIFVEQNAWTLWL